ncbi:hypothetical protein PR048_028452 [Dryococelus australis]|uniref:Uncharacterized protein n=1 Tax=Dryococelus australis TaxID=614101 RepID=A0ABQ9GEF9_9NEOP|nr:hypothetical protein PR048_028452 [Dryococelus australis]
MLTLEKKRLLLSLVYLRRRVLTIRCSDKFWSAVWSDKAMTTMKSSGGLTQGRGITDSVLVLRTLGLVYLHNVCYESEQ